MQHLTLPLFGTGGKWPETIAVVLWGTDNIKTYGESLAQVRPKCVLRPRNVRNTKF